MTEFDLNRQGDAKYTIEDLIAVVRRLFRFFCSKLKNRKP